MCRPFLRARGTQGERVGRCENRVWISDRAHVCLDLHQVVDGLEEGKGGEEGGDDREGIDPAIVIRRPEGALGWRRYSRRRCLSES
jgi:adenylosuccinate synthase